MPSSQRFVQPYLSRSGAIRVGAAVVLGLAYAGVFVGTALTSARVDGSTTDAAQSAPATPAAPSNKGTKPSPVAGKSLSQYVRAMDWELDFRPGALRLFTDAGSGKSYWYFTYKVINRTGKERMWAPRFELFTDGGAIVPSGRTVPTEITRSILQLMGNQFLQDQNQVIGEILIGEEHAKEGLVVWPMDDATVTEFTIFVAGASGKVRKVADPRNGQPRVERWAIRFNYLLPGDPLARGSRPVEPASVDEDIKEGADRRTDAGVWLWR